MLPAAVPRCAVQARACSADAGAMDGAATSLRLPTCDGRRFVRAQPWLPGLSNDVFWSELIMRERRREESLSRRASIPPARCCRKVSARSASLAAFARRLAAAAHPSLPSGDVAPSTIPMLPVGRACELFTSPPLSTTRAATSCSVFWVVPARGPPSGCVGFRS